MCDKNLYSFLVFSKLDTRDAQPIIRNLVKDINYVTLYYITVVIELLPTLLYHYTFV
jgi:hypothetical protein